MLAKQAPIAGPRSQLCATALAGPSCALHHARPTQRLQRRAARVCPRASATEERTYSVAMPELPAPASGTFTPGWTSFVEEHRVRGYEAGPDQGATIVSVANLLQVCARSGRCRALAALPGGCSLWEAAHRVWVLPASLRRSSAGRPVRLETDDAKRSPLPLQEIAANHAVALWGRSDQGFANLPSLKEFVFVMTRLQVQMDSYPKW